MTTLKKLVRTTAIVSVAAAMTATAYAGIGDHTEDGTGMQYGHARNFRADLGPQRYNFEVDVSDDVFTNPGGFGQVTGGMNFVDDNGDGVADIVQDSELFQALGIGPFVDENEDGIHDDFQTRAAYMALGMDNFVDVDGDAICDNYEENPLDN